MCVRLELIERVVPLGHPVALWLQGGCSAWLPWVGFARSENLHRWLGMGAQLVDIPATRFAVATRGRRRFRWENVPLGRIVQGLVDSNSGRPLLKIITRRSTPVELKRLGHARMPVIELPKVSAERILPPQPIADWTTMVEPALFPS